MGENSLSKNDVSKRLGEHGVFVLPEAADEIVSKEEPESLIKSIVEEVESGQTVDADFVTEISESADSSENGDEADGGVHDSSEENREEDEVAEDESLDRDREKVSDELIESPNKENSNRDTRENVKIDVANGESIDPYEALRSLETNEASTKDVEEVLNRKKKIDEKYPELADTMFDRELPEAKTRISVEESYEITGDVTGRSRGEGEFEDFRSLFEDRHDKMIDLLAKRTGQLYTVSDIHPRRHGGESLTVAGLVWDTFVSKNGYYFIDLEDPATNELLRVGWTDDSIKEVFEQVVPDEVIAVRGNLAEDGDIMWGDDEVRRGRPPVMFPDVPRRNNDNRPSKGIQAALISDIHVGADEFYPEYWNDFVDWIRTTPTVKYLFVAGDIVEGIGVYPDQDEELTVVDIYDQYAMAGKMFDQIPDDVKIFASVGNHDSVRLAEPQPTLEEEFTQFFPENVEFVGNPVTVNVNGVNVLMYHGMSLNALSEVVPGLDAENPIPIMELMLKKRHVAPVYGKNVRLAPEEKDYLVIETPPDILHCGHVHKYGKNSYNGVKMTNTAAWQGQTAFQKSKGIEPDPGYWSVVNLSTLDMEKYTVDDV